MAVVLNSFKTRVARRIFILFFICAILPVSVFAIISFINVRNSLVSQHSVSLQKESKSLATSLYEKLEFLRSELSFFAGYYETNPDGLNANWDSLSFERVEGRFNAFALLHNGEIKNIYGTIKSPIKISIEEWGHLESGKALLYLQKYDNSSFDLLMCMAVNSNTPENRLLIGKINHAYIQEVIDRRPPLTEIFVIDSSDIVLVSSIKDIPSISEKIKSELIEAPSGQFQWQNKGNDYLSGYSSLFLKPNFYLQEWTIVLSELRSDVLVPMQKSEFFYALTIAFILGLVIFLSINLIKKITVPIEILKKATRKISEDSLGHRVIIKSGDEFEELGNSFNEMSDRLKAGQELLTKAARLSTMGQMAAGIMHEIKQPLTAIYGNIELAMFEGKDENKRKDRLTNVLNAVERLNSILERFRSFSSQSQKIKETISLNDTVRQICTLMEHELLMKKIECEIKHEGSLPFIVGDGHELQQVISNLLVNAIHALEGNGDDNRRVVITTCSSADNVYLSIEDNGCGIPRELHDRIFDPFFTTKSPDKGTGLGMAVIQAILHHHKATIGLESEVGKGTKFTITFPRPGSETGAP
ncbi:MAG: HAMP domain-containing protein [Deltaproteobacteria bacterium]|nr:HAMP domain-containing protein [Deltaproteobacteria bacterium]